MVGPAPMRHVKFTVPLQLGEPTTTLNVVFWPAVTVAEVDEPAAGTIVNLGMFWPPGVVFSETLRLDAPPKGPPAETKSGFPSPFMSTAKLAKKLGISTNGPNVPSPYPRSYPKLYP